MLSTCISWYMCMRSQGGQNSIRSVFLRPSPPYFLKQGLSLNLELINYQPTNFLDPPVSASPVLGVQMCYHTWTSIWVLENLTCVLILARKAIYCLSHLPSFVISCCPLHLFLYFEGSKDWTHGFTLLEKHLCFHCFIFTNLSNHITRRLLSL